MPTYLPGKFGRFVNGGQAVEGAYRWSMGMKRERIDVTNFESDAAGENVYSEGVTGPVDTTFSVELYATAANLNVFYPQAPLICALYFKKSPPLGYQGVEADVLDLSPSTGVRETGKLTASLQANGLVVQAA
jgi:hypothetical protein